MRRRTYVLLRTRSNPVTIYGVHLGTPVPCRELLAWQLGVLFVPAAAKPSPSCHLSSLSSAIERLRYFDEQTIVFRASLIRGLCLCLLCRRQRRRPTVFPVRQRYMLLALRTQQNQQGQSHPRRRLSTTHDRQRVYPDCIIDSRLDKKKPDPVQ